MKNAGLFSTLFLDEIQGALDTSDDAQGRLVTLSQSYQRRDAASTDSLWCSFIKAALGNLGFVVNDQPFARGLYGLFEDYSFTNCIALLYAVEPGANLDDESVGRFWPAKLITALRDRKLNWGILTDGAKWRLYSTKSAKPYEDHVELDLGTALEGSDETTYALFERFFHADSFIPRDPAEYDTDKVTQLKALGLKAKKQKRQEAASSDEETAADSAEREAGIYLCRLDLDGEVSEAILEARVKEPLLVQVDNVLRYICNGFIADTPRTGAAYTEEERREVFESSVKLLYRCLFLFYAEARELLPSEDRHREIYAPHSINTLCREARKFRWNERDDTAGYDLWQQLKGLVQAVNEGDPTYGVMGYNGGLFDDEEERFLGKHRLRNDFLAHALYWLAFVDPAGGQRDDEYAIPYEDLEVRHLGEMYESILEFKVLLADVSYLRRRTKKGVQTVPAAGQVRQESDIVIRQGDIFFGETADERKRTGSYYTPESLVRFLVGKAVIAPLKERWQGGYSERFAAFLTQTRDGYDDAARRGALRSAEELMTQFVEREVLTYKVCDPAMGSGHFLVAAANLMTELIVDLLAPVAPSSPSLSAPFGNVKTHGGPNHWRRLITRHCLYGADLNPLAVNLAKLALWLNCFARNHKLTFLDHHLRCGNTLIGLRDIAALNEIPERRKDTRTGRDSKDSEQVHFDLKMFGGELYGATQAIAAIPNLAEDDTDRQREAFAEASRTLHRRFAPFAHLYTAYLIEDTLRPKEYVKLVNHFSGDRESENLSDELDEIWRRVCYLNDRHHFFHWPLEFPDVFAGVSSQGFSAIVGNPPWERTALEELEFFARSSPEVMAAPTTAIRKQVIQNLHRTKPQLFEEYSAEKEKADGESTFVVSSGLYPLGARGRLNTYALFADLGLRLLCQRGCLGMVLQSGLASDAPMEKFWRFLVKDRRLIAFIDFENKKRIFQAVHPEQKFALVSFAGTPRERGSPITVGFWLQAIDELHRPTKVYTLDIEDLDRFSPNTGQPVLTRRRSDIDVLRRIYATSDVCWHTGLKKGRAKAWVAMTSAAFSAFCRREDDLTGASQCDDWGLQLDGALYSPLLEAKQMHQYNCCFSTYDGVFQEELEAGEPRELFHGDGALLNVPKPRFWAKKEVVDKFIRAKNGNRGWCLGYRDVTNVNNERTAIATVLPSVGFLQPLNGISCSDARSTAIVLAAINSFTCDFVARLRFTGRHLNVTTFSQLPIPRWIDASFVVPRVVELVYTGNCLKSFATDCEFEGGPYEWNASRRFQLKCELDAAFGHFYGLTKDDMDYVFRSFNVLRSREESECGRFRTRDTVLELFDNLKEELKHAQE